MKRFNSVFRPGLFDQFVCVVTGGGSGIGRVVAHELSSLGASLVLAGRTKEKLESVAKEISLTGGVAEIKTTNIRDENSIAELFEFTLDQFGKVSGVVNSAGGQYVSRAEAINTKGWNAVIETNLHGTFYACKCAFQSYMKDHGGSIVNLVNGEGRGYPGMCHSGAANSGAIDLTKSLAVEWASNGIRINSVSPGLVEGSGLESYDDKGQKFIDQAKKNVPLRRLGSESEVSTAVTFLLSPATSYITGVNLVVDGAKSLWRGSWDIPEQPQKLIKRYEGFD